MFVGHGGDVNSLQVVRSVGIGISPASHLCKSVIVGLVRVGQADRLDRVGEPCRGRQLDDGKVITVIFFRKIGMNRNLFRLDDCKLQECVLTL